MTKKNKIMLAAAIVAAVLLVGSGVARCTIVQNGTIEGRAAVESAEEAAAENPQSETDAANGEANSGIESLVGTSWVGVDDATRSLSIVKGAFVETKDGSTEVTYWTLDSEEPLSSGIEATVGIDAAKIEAAVSTRAAAVSPSATRAIWDAEAWIDYANNAATTTFTLDDGASTMISVTRSSDGTIEAL